MLGNYLKALEHAEYAEEMATRAGNARDIALSCKVLGDIYLTKDKEGNLKAQEFYERSLEHYKKQRNKIQIAKLQRILGMFSNPAKNK
jgi:hypothetical protein